MKPNLVGGVILTAAVCILRFGDFSIKTEKQVAKPGPVVAYAEKPQHVAIPAISNWICVASGGVLVATGFQG